MNAVELHKRSLGMPDSWYENVLEFHRRFAPHVLASVPAVPPGGPEAHYGPGAIREELAELERAATTGDVPGVADALGDLVYVTIRMALIWGVDLRPVFAEIHSANLRKIGGGIREDSKVQKPPGWVGPDIEGVLRAQGWVAPPDPPADRPSLRDATLALCKYVKDIRGCYPAWLLSIRPNGLPERPCIQVHVSPLWAEKVIPKEWQGYPVDLVKMDRPTIGGGE
jgi:predicted HAD superfamily Cof-like phosphohydrolase